MPMMSTFLIVILLTCEAFAITLDAVKTNPANFRYGSGSSPRPTSGPKQVKAGLKRAAELFRRSVDPAWQTCGYVDQDPNDAVTCGAGYACAWYYSGYSQLTQGVLQCCTTTGTSIAYESCDPGSACVDYYPRYNTGAEAVLESGTWYCGSVGQTCATYLFEGGRSYWSSSLAAEIYTGLYCGDFDTTQDVYQGYTGEASTSLSSSSSSSSSAPPTSSSTTSPQSTAPDTTSSQSGASSTPTATSGGSSSSNTGAIAGATVGGVVGLAAIGATVGYLVWRKKKQSLPPSREISNYDGYY